MTDTGNQSAGEVERAFWKSSGLHLLERNSEGWLTVTPQFLLAYWTRPEVHPVEESCANEIAIHEALLADPFRPVSEVELASFADPDAVETYRIVLGFREILMQAGTVEGAYLRIIRDQTNQLPPVFLEQLVHVIARNMLDGITDPVRVRAAEILFRPQKVSTPDGRLMLADEEIIEMQAQMGNTGLAQLLSETATPMRDVSLDVLDDDNAETYWERSDRFDMVVDFRFEQPALDAFARVIETWLHHLLRLPVHVEPRPRLDDTDWRWHIGLDREATALLNALYERETVSLEDMARIVALFRMTIRDESAVIDRLKGRPVYLGLAMDDNDVVRMKPQNLLVNLPLIATN